jgi:arsenate reductase (thioredoxin)
MSEPSLVLFVFLPASAKSLIAMEYFNKLAAERRLPFRALSVGTEPDDAVPPHVVAGLGGDGFDVSRRKPQRLTKEVAMPARIAVSFGPELVGFVDPTCKIEQWDVPAVSDGYAIARTAIKARVERLVAGLAT